MSERDRLQRRIRDLEDVERGLHSNISNYQRGVIQAQREKSDAGRFTDAYLRQQAADRRIRDLESSIRSSNNELRRIKNQIRGLESELRSLR